MKTRLRQLIKYADSYTRQNGDDMKKYIAIILALTMIISIAVYSGAEEMMPESFENTTTSMQTDGEVSDVSDLDMELTEMLTPEVKLFGDWYGTLHGLTLCLTLQEEDAYTIAFPALSREPVTGKWILSDGFIYMDDEETPSISMMGDVLLWTAAHIFLRREEPDGEYIPADVYADAVLEDFSDYWESVFIDLDGALVSASDLQDDTFIYIEGTNVALGGSIFGNVIEEFTFADAAMTCQEGDGSMIAQITMQLLEDGILAVTLTTSTATEGETTTLKMLLAPAYNEYAESRATQE